MKVYLIVAKGSKRGMPVPITVDLFLMGSDKMCQLRSAMEGIASQHCAITTRDNKVFIRDLGRGGKTIINADLMPAGDEWPLHAGDHVAVGPLEFLIQFNEKQLSQKDAEEWALKALDVDAARMLEKQQAAMEQEQVEMEKRAGSMEHSTSSAPAAPKPPEGASSAAAAILDKLQMQKGLMMGRLRVAVDQGVTIIRFTDMYLVEESEIGFIKKELMGHLGRKGQRILLDFKSVRRMSSSAGEMILEVMRRVKSQSGSLAICRVRPDTQEVLKTLRVLPLVPYFDDKKVALGARW